MKQELDKIFKPQSIAVIGASNKEGSVGFSLMKNLLENDYKGRLVPINFKYKKIHGLDCYSSVKELKEPMDLAIIATPARTVIKLLEECAEMGISGVVILSAGFKEAGKEGKKWYAQIVQFAKAHHIRIIGPNCIGFIHPAMNLNASFLSRMALPGKIAFISQSGALCASILDWAVDQKVGFSHFVSIGSMIDVDFADLIDYYGADDQTSCILIYMESLLDASKFMTAARAFANDKPIIVLKAGQSEEGAKAALSHTGALAGNDAVYDAAFRRAGIIRVETIAQLFHCAQALATQPRPAGNKLTIVTNAGGPGILATDYLIKNGGQLAEISKTTSEKLNAFLPAHWSHNNPVDVLGDADAQTYKEAVRLCLQDEGTDAVLAIFTTQDVTDPTEAAEALAELATENSKTIFACWMGEQDVQPGRDLLENVNIPHYRYPESAVDVFLKMYNYTHNLELLAEKPTEIPRLFEPQKESVEKLINEVRAGGRYQLTEFESKKMLEMYGIPITASKVANTILEAGEAAAEIGFPVVMKIMSPDIGHKIEVKGVQLNIKTTEEAKQAFSTIMENIKKFRPAAHVEGVLVEKMIDKRFELLIGAKKDPIFGPVIVFGTGGTLVELWKDTNIGLSPLTMAIAKRIIEN